jgi:hypothetical protein
VVVSGGVKDFQLSRFRPCVSSMWCCPHVVLP